MIGILSFWADLPYSLLSDPFMVFKLPVSRSWSVGTWRSAFLSRVPCWFETIPRMQSVAQCPRLSRDDGCGIFDKGLSQAQIATLQATLDSLKCLRTVATVGTETEEMKSVKSDTTKSGPATQDCIVPLHE